MITTSNFQSIRLLRNWCMLTLPTVFNDTLSYNEQVCKLTEALNQQGEIIKGLPEYIEQIVKELLEQAGLEDIVKQVLADYLFIDVKNPPAPLVPAVGDGVADDTVAIQAMIDYVAGKSNYLFFPAGTYSVQGLNMVPGISLIGLNRYNTTIMLRPSSNRDLLIGELGQCTISNVALNANMPGQTANCSIFEGNVTDMLVSNVILKNGYNVLSIDCDGIVQMDNIVIDGTQGNGLSIGGVRAMIRGITFTKNSTLNAGTLITITGENNMLSDVLNTDYAVNGIVINGNNNSVKGWISGTTTAITNNGTNNEINVYTGTDLIYNTHNVTETIDGFKHQTISSNNDVTITGNNGITINGSSTENITGSKTEKINSNLNISANNTSLSSALKTTFTSTTMELNPENPLIYSKPYNINKYFDGIKMTDTDGLEYDLLVKNNNTSELSEDIIYSVLSFGATGDGTTDDTIALQNAITFVENINGVLYIPKGTYVITNSLTINNAITIIGDGYGVGATGTGQVNKTKASNIESALTFTGTNLLNIITTSQVKITGLLFSNKQTWTDGTRRATGAGIYIKGKEPDELYYTNNQTNISYCGFIGMNNCIQLRQVVWNKIYNNFFHLWSNYAVYYEGGLNTEENLCGWVENNFFFGDAVAGSTQRGCILIKCGYIFISKNYIGGGNSAIVGEFDGYEVGSIFITENSIEQQNNTGIHLYNANNTNVAMVNISNNNFSNQNLIDQFNTLLYIQKGTSRWIKNVIISGNTSNCTLRTASHHFSIQDGTNVIVSNNVLNNNGVANSSALLIVNAENVTVSNNIYTGFLTENTVNESTCYTCFNKSYTVASMPTNAGNGSMVIVSDGAKTSDTDPILKGGGNGTLAFKLNNIWYALY